MPLSRRPRPDAAAPQVQAEALDPLISTIMPPVPEPAVGLTRQGLARYAVGDYRAAEQAFRAVVEVAGHEPMAWNNLALVRWRWASWIRRPRRYAARSTSTPSSSPPG